VWQLIAFGHAVVAWITADEVFLHLAYKVVAQDVAAKQSQ
jgi:hypothetical protein